MLLKLRYLFPILILVLGKAEAQSSDTTITVDFQVTTSSPGGNYSPRNIGAIWIESSTGEFVQTLRVWGSRRQQYLYTWNNQSGGNTVDGVTGATYSSHATRSASWDFTDVNGNEVLPGDYTLRLELTDQHGQGPLYSFSFPFGGPTEAITPPDQATFHSMQLSYDLSIVVGVDGQPHLIPEQVVLEQNYPNPFNPETTIPFSLLHANQVQISIYDLHGGLVQSLASRFYQKGQHQVIWDATNDEGEAVPSGMYLCRLRASGVSQEIKIVYSQ